MQRKKSFVRLGWVLLLAATACEEDKCDSAGGQDASIPLDGGDTCADRHPGPCAEGIFDITKNPAVPSGRVLYSYDSRGNLVKKETYSLEDTDDDEDGGALTEDGGVMTSDGGVMTSDGGVMTSDGGVMTSDGGVMTSEDGGVMTSEDGGVMTSEQLISVGVYTYDERDRLIKAEYDEDGDGDIDVIYIYTYEDDGDLPETGRQTNVICGNVTMNGACFDFGKNKLQEAEIDSNGDGEQDGRVTYHYNDKGWLVGIETDEYLFGFPNRTERFIYDGEGNRVRWEVDDEPFADYQYDHRGNVTRIDGFRVHGSEYLYDEHCNRIGLIIGNSRRFVADFSCWEQ